MRTLHALLVTCLACVPPAPPGKGPSRDAAGALDGGATTGAGASDGAGPVATFEASVSPDARADEAGDAPAGAERSPDVARPPDTRPPTGEGGPLPPPQDAAAPTPLPPSLAPVFDPAVLHRIEVRVDSQHLVKLASDTEERVPCTIVYDGTTLPSAGIRRKGGVGSGRPLTDKPGFSVKLNQFVMGQKLAGMSKIIFNNAVQDPSFLNEHIGYEMARRAGLAAPLTAHGLLTFNGTPKGLYVVREAINDDFLERSYGKGNDTGNLYEGSPVTDFIDNPDGPSLKDEKEEMRSRADIREVSRLFKTTPAAQWMPVMGSKIDIPQFINALALEWVVGHWDGYFFGINNYYLYNHPGSQRFVYLVAGIDYIFAGHVDNFGKASLTRRLLETPETNAQFKARVADIIAGMNVPEIHARMDAVARILRSHTPTDARTREDYASFDRTLPERKAAISTIKRDGRQSHPF